MPQGELQKRTGVQGFRACTYNPEVKKLYLQTLK
jgi:hypothetical protein